MGPSTTIVVTDPYRAACAVLRAFQPEPTPTWGVAEGVRIGPGARWQGRVSLGRGAVIGSGARLGRDCAIGPGAVIGDGVVLGDGCWIGPHAVVESGAILGQRVHVASGARIGGPGYSYTPSPAGPMPVPHAARCIIGDDVDVGANSVIDRGAVEDTVIGSGTKIDSQVKVAHHVRIGVRCLIMAQTGIAGSVVIGDDVILAGQAGLADHARIGDGARVAAQGGVIGSVPAGATVSGYPARDHRDVLRQTAALRRLTPLVSSLETIAEAHVPTD